MAKTCAYSGNEIKGAVVPKVDLMVDNNTKIEVRVMKRIGPNSFLQGDLSEATAKKIAEAVQPLARPAEPKGTSK